MNITLRQGVAEDRSFAKATYFETQRAILGKLFGWTSDKHESLHFDGFYSEAYTQIILADDQEAGFISLIPRRTHTDIQCLFLRPAYQGRGIGTHLLQGLIAQADADGTRLTIGTQPINPARRLYERLGFVVTRETRYRIDFVYPKEGSA